MKKTTIILFVLSLFTLPIYAAPLSPKNFPTDLLFAGKPVDAACFSQLAEMEFQINLKKCREGNPKIKMTDARADFIAKSFVGQEWEDQEYHSQGFDYYQAFPADNKQYWLYTINNGGGTGSFSSIGLAKRINEETMHFKTIVGGDRCNGGIAEVDIKNQQLNYEVYLTPYEVVKLAKDKPRIEAYDNLSSCASCCVAKALYTIENSSAQPILQSVKFDDLTLPEQGSHQACFNKLFSSYVAKGKTKLDVAAINQFAIEFNQQCVKG